MTTTTMTAIDNIKSLKYSRLNLERRLQDLSKNRSNLESKIMSNSDLIQILNGSTVIADFVSSYFSEKYIGECKQIVNNFLAKVFYDEKYEIEIEFEKKRNQNEVYFYLVEHNDGQPDIKTDMNNIGSGVKAVISFAFQIFIVMKAGVQHVLFLDESFTEVQTSYLERLMFLIHELIQQLSFSILLITNDIRIQNSEFIDQHLKMETGTLKLI